jgi:hypothetical protein
MRLRKGQNKEMKDFLFGLGAAVWGIVWLALWDLRLAIGFLGITAYAGIGWAIISILVSSILNFEFHLTVGCFYFVWHILGWHWLWSLLFVSPEYILFFYLFLSLRRDPVSYRLNTMSGAAYPLVGNVKRKRDIADWASFEQAMADNPFADISTAKGENKPRTPTVETPAPTSNGRTQPTVNSEE